VENIRDDLHVAPEKRVLGAQDVTRWFSGTSVGSASVDQLQPGFLVRFERRSTRSSDGFELETVMSIGREKWSNRPMQHLDMWVDARGTRQEALSPLRTYGQAASVPTAERQTELFGWLVTL